MIELPKLPVMFGGIDLMKFFAVGFQILIDKKILTENELVGYLVRAGFNVTNNSNAITPTMGGPGNENLQ